MNKNTEEIHRSDRRTKQREKNEEPSSFQFESLSLIKKIVDFCCVFKIGFPIFAKNACIRKRIYDENEKALKSQMNFAGLKNAHFCPFILVVYKKKKHLFFSPILWRMRMNQDTNYWDLLCRKPFI